MAQFNRIISRVLLQDGGRIVGSQVRATSSYSNGKYRCDFESVKSAMKNIKPYISRTPLSSSSYFNELSGRRLVFKEENRQETGSFKIRGATNAVMNLKKKSTKPNCVLTHSSGNHGVALSHACQSILKVPCFVVMPESSSTWKIDAVKSAGGKVVFCPDTQKGRSEVGSLIIRDRDGVFIHPSQNADVIAGQGTLGLEILEQNGYVDTIVVPVGGGGMIAGIAIAAKAINPAIRIIAAEPEVANDCEISKQRGELTPIETYPSTVADGVRINIGLLTRPPIRDLVDDVITVSESEINSATIKVFEKLKLVIEPTSGVAVAAVLSEKFKRVKGNHVAVVLCGGNVDLLSFLMTLYK